MTNKKIIIAILLVFSINFSNVNAQIELTYKVETDKKYEWKFTQVEGEITEQEKTTVFFIILTMWMSRVEGDLIYEYVNSYGLYLDENVAIIIESIPITSVTENLNSNADFPQGSIETPRKKFELLSISPNFGLPFFIPINPDISNRYENMSFNENGLLIKYTKSIKYNEKWLLATLELVTKTAEGFMFVFTIFSFIGIIYYRRRGSKR